MAVRKELRNNVMHDSESTTTNFAINSSKWNVIIESHVRTCIDCMSFDFLFEDILSSVLLKIITVLLANHP